MILTFVLRYVWHGLNYIPYNKDPWIDVDYTSIRHSRIGSMYNRRRSEALCYLELILFLTLRPDVVWTLYGHLTYVINMSSAWCCVSHLSSYYTFHHISTTCLSVRLSPVCSLAPQPRSVRSGSLPKPAFHHRPNWERHQHAGGNAAFSSPASCQWKTSNNT